MKRKAISMLLVVAMLVTLATPAFATYVDEDFPEDAIVIEVNTLEELFDAINQYSWSEYDVVIYVGCEIVMEEFEVFMSEQRALPAKLLVWAWGIFRGSVVSGIFILATGQSQGAWVADALRAYARGTRGTWHWNARCCCHP